MIGHTEIVSFVLSALFAAPGDVLWDNGLDYSNGVAHLGEPRRSNLDDFTVTGRGWSLSEFSMIGASEAGATLQPEHMELTIFEDALGSPGETIVAQLSIETIEVEFWKRCHGFCGLKFYRVTASIADFNLSPGTYWLDTHFVQPDNSLWFQVIAPINKSPAWIHYEDWAGGERRPASDLFGEDLDINFILSGTEIPAVGVLPVFVVASLIGRRSRRRILNE